MRTTIIDAGLIALTMACAPFAVATERADSVVIDGGTFGLGVGGNWGDGVLTFEGYRYPFSVGGVTIGDVGATGFTASGEVHNLTRPEDFNGTYAAIGAGLTIAGGAGAVSMRNQHGVTIDLVDTSRGLRVALEAGGINVHIPDSGFAAVRAQRAADAAAARAEHAA